MQIATLTLSHEDTPVAVRERFALNGEALRDAVSDLAGTIRSLPGHRAIPLESAVVSTCNRTEIYVAGPAGTNTGTCAFRWLEHRFGMSTDDLRSHWRMSVDRPAVRHLFRVASGLESMVLGEPQILGQIKGAARIAHDAGALGSHLHKLFQNSFSVAKEVRSSTGVGHDSVSLGKAGVRLAQRVFENLSDCSVLFVGAGEMIELAAAHFAACSPGTMHVANRSRERGERLAAHLAGQWLPLDRLAGQIDRYDIVVTCTASPDPLITHAVMQAAMQRRKRKPMVLIDLAVPCDVEASIRDIDDVFVYTIDDLGRVVNDGLNNRQAAVGQAEAIIDVRTSDYMQWLTDRRSVPAIRNLHARAQVLREQEMQRALRALRRGDDPAQVLESMSCSLTAKFLHGPVQMFRGSASQRQAIADVVDSLLPSGGRDHGHEAGCCVTTPRSETLH